MHPIESLEPRIAPATIVAVTDNNGLFSFDSATPGTISTPIPIAGLSAGQFIKALDFRPANGLLYGLAISGTGPFTGQLYTIDPATAAATAVGAAFSATLTTATGYGIDFNPVVDLLRVVNGDEQNFRLNPATGALVQNDTAITGATSLSAVAYTNNYAGATATTLFGVDFTMDDLVTLGGLNSSPSPNGGVVTKIKDINVTTSVLTSDRLGLDILTTLEGNTAFYTGVVGGVQNFYTLNLASGAATLAGAISTGSTPVFDIAVQPPAPLAFPDGKTFTYTDGDGDLVTVKTTLGTLKSSQFSWLTSADGTRRELTAMTIAGDATFTGANLTFTAKKTASGGDGRVEVGTLNATGLNLGAVKIRGNLERIIAGTGDAAIPALKNLDVLSFGRVPGGTDIGATASTITGNVSVFKIKGDFDSAALTIMGKAGSVFIGGSVIGADGSGSGNFSITQGTKSFTLGGSILGGDGPASGVVSLSGSNVAVKIGGSVVSSTGFNSGRLSVGATGVPITSFILSGSIVGGGDSSESAEVNIGDVITARIGGSIIGGGARTGTFSFGNATSLTVNGSIIGGDDPDSGVLDGNSAARVNILGSIIGGTGGNGGAVKITTVGAFTLGGSLFGGDLSIGDSGFLDFMRAGTVAIRGSVIGQPGSPAMLAFRGLQLPGSAADSIAVKSLTIGGSVVNGSILIGGPFGALGIVNAAAGKITIGGDFLASTISAGFLGGFDGFLGNGDDTAAGSDSLPDIPAAIGSIIIKGRASGTASDGDHYGIVVEQLGSVMIGGRKLVLDPTAQDNLLVGSFGDFRVRENVFP